MKLAILGRTETLLAAAEYALQRGHEIPIVWTSRAEPHYRADEKAFAALARRCNALFRDELSINTTSSVEMMASLNCDAALSINFLTLFQAPLLNCFRLGVLNAHNGDLPLYRGNACHNWAVINGESRIAISIHLMTEALDAGPIILKSYRPINDDTYIEDICAWTRETTPVLMLQAVEGLNDGTLKPQPQSCDPEDVLRTFPRRPEDSRLDWSWSTERVLRLIRASSQPFAGAYCYLEGRRRVTVWRAEHYDYGSRFLAVPGQVCLRYDDHPVVACADGMVRLTDIEVEGIGSGQAAKKAIASSLRNRLT